MGMTPITSEELLVMAVVIPLSGMLESEFMEGEDDADEQESYQVNNSMIMNRSNN
jgi:hypothetical protein